MFVRLSLPLLALAGVTALPCAQNLSFVPVEDGTAKESDPSTSFPDDELRVDFDHSASGARVDRAYLRFDVRGIDGLAIQCVTLKLTEGSGASGSNTNFEVRRVNGGWSEAGLTWNNKPAAGKTVGAYLGDSPSSGEELYIALDPSFLSGDGIYDLALIEDKNGGFQDVSFYSREDARPPELLIGCDSLQAHAAFWVRQTERPVPYTVDFEDLSTGNADTFLWDFGDGATSTERHPTHTYTEPDRYTVTLTASGPAGSQTVTRTDYVLAYPADQGPGSVASWSKVSATSGGNVPNLRNEDMFARGVASIGDLDGDGVLDLLVGAVGDDDGADKAGAAYVLFLNADGTVRDSTKLSALSGGLPFTLDAHDGFGRVVAGIGDLNGDGVLDVAVGANRDDDGGSNRGAIYVLFLKADGTVDAAQKISDTEGGFSADLDNGDEFGRGITSLGDLNGDGVPDLAVGATGDDDGAGSNGAVYVLFMNRDGTVASHQKLSATQGGLQSPFFPGLWFGMSVASLGDVDGDGLQDLAVGGNQDDAGGESSGAAYVILMNPDGTARADWRITAAEGGVVWGEIEMDDEFGAAIAGPGDVDGDGIPDLAVGSIRDNDNHAGNTEIFVDRGAVYVFFLDADGSVRDYQKISDTRGNFSAPLSHYDRFGEALGAPGDFNGDGTPDLLVGSRFDDDGGPNRGAFYFLFLNGSGPVQSAPDARFTGGPRSGEAPLSVTFDDLSSGTYSQWAWDFGDGETSAEPEPTHLYTVPGTYSVSLTVSGAVGSSTRTYPDVITVEGHQAPTAAFEADPTGGVAPLRVTFDDLSAGAIDSWSWDFGDGGTSTLREPTYTYALPGTYSVGLTVGGPGGTDTLLRSDLVVVGEDVPPLAAFDADPLAGAAPLTVGFTDLSTGGIDAWSWSFGDGGTSSEREPTHTYAGEGTYTVTLTVTGPRGSDVATAPDLIQVDPPPADPAITRYGCGVNPVGSLTVVSGRPVLGTQMVFGVHNPLGTQGAGALSKLFLAFGADPAFPCGTPVPGLGMTGGDGAVLIGRVAPDPVRRLDGATWSGTQPAEVPFAFPHVPALAGLELHAQGLLIDPAPAAAVPLGLTDGLKLILEL